MCVCVCPSLGATQATEHVWTATATEVSSPSRRITVRQHAAASAKAAAGIALLVLCVVFVLFLATRQTIPPAFVAILSLIDSLTETRKPHRALFRGFSSLPCDQRDLPHVIETDSCITSCSSSY